MRSLCHALFVILWLVLFAASGASAQTVIPRSVIGNGGGSASNGAVSLNATLGQPIIGTRRGPASAPFLLQQGFWFAALKASAPTGVANGHVGAGSSVNVFTNPVSSEAVVSIELPAPCHMKAVLFDRLGQQVATLVDEDRTAGSHRLSLDAAALPSGSYLLHVQTGAKLQTIPVAIVR
jgi:hypothetical protein